MQRQNVSKLSTAIVVFFVVVHPIFGQSDLKYVLVNLKQTNEMKDDTQATGYNIKLNSYSY